MSATAAAAPVGTRRAVSASSEPTVGARVVRTRLRLTRRGRVVVTTLAALPLVAALGLSALDGDGAVASDTASGAEFDWVTVEGGSSLWQVAEQVAPGADPRDVVSDLVRLNALPSSEVQPGQRLAVPERYAD